MLGIAAQQAQADSFTFSSVGQSYTANFQQAVTVSGTNYNLTGTVQYTVTSMTSTGVTFTVVVSNTSNTGTNQGIVSTGFQSSNPTLASSTLTQMGTNGLNNESNKFVSTATNVNAPGGFQNVELCAYTSNNCSSAKNPATLSEGKHDTFSVALTYLSPATSNTFTINTTFIRFAGALGSYTFGSCNPNCGGTLPLPSSLSLIGLGMAAWGLARRRLA